MSIEERKAAASKVYSATLKKLNFNYEGRNDLCAALISEAKSAGYEGRDVQFIASFGLAQSGFGGGA